MVCSFTPSSFCSMSDMYSIPNNILEKLSPDNLVSEFLADCWKGMAELYSTLLNMNATLTLLLSASSANGFGKGILGNFYQK